MHIEQNSQEQLIRGLAHRMNNILTLFHGYLGLVMDNALIDSSTRQSLSRIKDGATSATELIDRTYSLVRSVTVTMRETDSEFLLGLLKPTFQGLGSPKTKIEVEVSPDMPRFWTDATLLKKALMELVRNACEATADKGGTVKIGVQCQPEAAAIAVIGEEPNESFDWVLVTVSDDGPGITMATAARMFQPFYTTRKRSAGLGLNVAMDSVQRLGGILSHSSKPGETRFSILLPLHKEAPAVVEETTNSEERTTTPKMGRR